MSGPRHLVSVWNPSYAADAMDAHLACLLGWAERAAAGAAGADDVYVWWAKLRSPNRQQPLPHTADVLALDAQAQEGTETHLYLTDYRSLYVGHLAEVTADDVFAQAEGEREHAPEYYAGRPADFWFRLWDLRRLVTDDTVETVQILRRLRNVHYARRPVSLYGGMVDLPLVVEAEEEHRWFADVDLLVGGRLWAERDAELRGETARLEVELRENLLGRAVWATLEPASRTFLATAEAVFRSRRDRPALRLQRSGGGVCEGGGDGAERAGLRSAAEGARAAAGGGADGPIVGPARRFSWERPAPDARLAAEPAGARGDGRAGAAGGARAGRRLARRRAAAPAAGVGGSAQPRGALGERVAGAGRDGARGDPRDRAGGVDRADRAGPDAGVKGGPHERIRPLPPRAERDGASGFQVPEGQMKVTYDPEVDVLRIVLSGRAIKESEEENPGVILDYDRDGNVVGMEILAASQRVENPRAMDYAIRS
ncbi:hypothetical protein BH23GEM4_BH23GEM4_25340 [soil metagenome]